MSLDGENYDKLGFGGNEYGLQLDARFLLLHLIDMTILSHVFFWGKNHLISSRKASPARADFWKTHEECPKFGQIPIPVLPRKQTNILV